MPDQLDAPPTLELRAVSKAFDVRGQRIPFGQAGGCASPQVLVNASGVFDTVVVNGVSQSLARQLTFFCGD